MSKLLNENDFGLSQFFTDTGTLNDESNTAIRNINTAANTTYLVDMLGVIMLADGSEASGYRLQYCFKDDGGTISNVGSSTTLRVEDNASTDLSMTFSNSGSAHMIVRGSAPAGVHTYKVTVRIYENTLS